MGELSQASPDCRSALDASAARLPRAGGPTRECRRKDQVASLGQVCRCCRIPSPDRGDIAALRGMASSPYTFARVWLSGSGRNRATAANQPDLDHHRLRRFR
jgi:hypothetical protein